MTLVWMFLGFLLLVLGGEFIVRASIAISLKFNISKVVIGMTVVAFATSLPELLVSLKAAVNGSSSIAINNVIGSNIANIGLAAELLGLSTAAFEKTVVYLTERKQFGRIIGSFQGLQHRAAELYAELELARSIVLQALQAIDEDNDKLPLLASAAKAKLCEVAQQATNEGIQMHGGVGMTDEYEIGFYIKRARVAQQTLGDYNYHLDRYATLSGF